MDFLAPDAVDRVRASPSPDRAHWPIQGAIHRNGRYHLCLAGTKSYMLFHLDPGFVIGLAHLVSVLALACKRPPANR